MEWETVCLLDDFSPELTKHQSDQEETNILYVAVTRAKKNLVINPACFYTLLSVGMKFEKVILTPKEISCSCGNALSGLCAARATSISRSNIALMTLDKDYPKAVQAATLCSTCAGLFWYSPPRFQPYGQSLPCQLQNVETDRLRLTMRFALGPKSEEERQTVQPLYDSELARLQGRFIQANQLVVGIAMAAIQVKYFLVNNHISAFYKNI